jgi:cobalt/nickel transport protein
MHEGLLWPKKLAIAMVLLILASPIGVLLVWDYGAAWGEWGEVGSWVPRSYWTAPVAEYNLPGWDSQFMASMGYILSAIIGIVAIIVFTYALMVLVARRKTDG